MAFVRQIRTFLITLCALHSLSTSANAESASDLLTKAIIELGQGKIDLAKRSLDEALAAASDPILKSKIHRQFGILFEADNQLLESLVSFRVSLGLNPNISLSTREHQGRPSALFRCAQNLDIGNFSVEAIRKEMADKFSTQEVNCPIDSNGQQIVVTPVPALLDLDQIKEQKNQELKQASWLSSPTFWIIASIALAGSATAAGFYFAPPTGGNYGGSSDTTIRLSN